MNNTTTAAQPIDLDKLEAILKDALMWVAGATCEQRIKSALALIAQARTARLNTTASASALAEHAAWPGLRLRSAAQPVHTGEAASNPTDNPEISIGSVEFFQMLIAYSNDPNLSRRLEIANFVDAHIDALLTRATLAPVAAQQAAAKAPAAPSDEQIIAALHANGIDTYPSKYGFDAVQVSATSVPSLRNVFAALYATAVAATTSEDARDALAEHIAMIEESGWVPADGSISAEELMKIGRKWMRGREEHRGANDFLFTRTKFLKMVSEAIDAVKQEGRDA